MPRQPTVARDQRIGGAIAAATGAFHAVVELLYRIPSREKKVAHRRRLRHTVFVQSGQRPIHRLRHAHYGALDDALEAFQGELVNEWHSDDGPNP